MSLPEVNCTGPQTPFKPWKMTKTDNHINYIRLINKRWLWLTSIYIILQSLYRNYEIITNKLASPVLKCEDISYFVLCLAYWNVNLILGVGENNLPKSSQQFKSSHNLFGFDLTHLSRPDLTVTWKHLWLGLWLDFICFMTWLEFEHRVDLKRWICSLLEESHPQSFSQFATFDVMAQNQGVSITHAYSIWLHFF